MKFFYLLLLIPFLSFANQKITIALDWYINPDHATLLIAKDKGYFEQHHLSVKFISPTSADEPLKMAALGQVDMAITYEPTWLMASGQSLKTGWVATLVGQPLDAVVTNSDIHHLSDLKGKRLGYSSSETGHALVKTMLKHVGVKPQQVGFINVQMDLMQALLSHRVSAVSGLGRNVEVVELRQEGHAVQAFYPENYGVPSYSELILVEKPGHLSKQTLKEFRAALTQAVQYIHQHPKAAWRLAKKMNHAALADTPKMAKLNEAIWKATVPVLDLNPGVFKEQQYLKFKAYLANNVTSLGTSPTL